MVNGLGCHFRELPRFCSNQEISLTGCYFEADISYSCVESWPGDLVDALLEEVTATMNGREDAPALLLEATDRERTWQIATGSGQAQEVSGKAADLLAGLTGRSTGEGLATAGVLPTPPHWM